MVVCWRPHLTGMWQYRQIVVGWHFMNTCMVEVRTFVILTCNSTNGSYHSCIGKWSVLAWLIRWKSLLIYSKWPANKGLHVETWLTPNKPCRKWLYVYFLSIHYAEPDNCGLLGLLLIAWTTGNTFLSILVTLCDAQIRPNKCNSYVIVWSCPLV